MEFFIILFLIGVAKTSAPLFDNILDLLKSWKLVRDLIGKSNKVKEGREQATPSQLSLTLPPVPAGAGEVSISIDIDYKFTSSQQDDPS